MRVPARADEITDQFDRAHDYSDQGDLTGAIGVLEFALLATYPIVTPGNMLSRTYRARVAPARSRPS